MDKEKLNEILEKHKKWLTAQPGGARADLCGADLCGADLCEADLRGADLRGADLCEADLCGADLRGADLRGASLYGADLCGADLRGAGLYGELIPTACPEEGSFIGYKKAGGHIVKLEITEDSARLSGTGRKCRCQRAKVLEIQNLDGSISALKSVPSDYTSSFIYEVGAVVEEPDFDHDRWNECSQGIHFFINRLEAVDYQRR